MFGGFATDSWRLGPKFYGKPESFLFQLSPTVGVFDSTPFNSNYQYFNLKQKTMPNGLGMGGQLEYFGLWIDSEFGLVRKLFWKESFENINEGANSANVFHLPLTRPRSA